MQTHIMISFLTRSSAYWVRNVIAVCFILLNSRLWPRRSGTVYCISSNMSFCCRTAIRNAERQCRDRKGNVLLPWYIFLLHMTMWSQQLINTIPVLAAVSTESFFAFTNANTGILYTSCAKRFMIGIMIPLPASRNDGSIWYITECSSRSTIEVV
ncbi:hypothetical protein K469DRAFT_205389 [Zopfia rhizophila CBS 207.26]|uniref:Uncharacterized protein n=1 Tax=Zopfia rhizophila CBS 207.26 TaxID=1314779 RepID=A0A6A6DXZ3_9PEZI|nr:hypothetical protein K469DRAFT_205389 [Zopfia rhizophila CBS 207.26]